MVTFHTKVGGTLKLLLGCWKNKFRMLLYFLCEIMLNTHFKSMVHNLLDALMNERNMMYICISYIKS